MNMQHEPVPDEANDAQDESLNATTKPWLVVGRKLQADPSDHRTRANV
jgi:hypothetical protein|eukprot:CAMPEP_0174386708 /NCGR_PEP_ID=MMETSP0811_2-20130205/127458_1 /TAXON_ID=73025 ORGANISM="Eutreptiella gymnastica-like, Strain CCMP1594" /NCGR_SAMPLE_ID=MMETSP0811_2 /ASSEMBLY_ACC=CAM_ASM_000667 /LENGTH=47 /DNA_ID= /DNA_START= /DNA_END= /DNA_ORIENTATION=